MKKLAVFIGGLLITGNIYSQLCPGGGSTFSAAALFDQTWTLGCSSGTSCTGGTTFDNRTTCESTTTMDGCAPTSTCGTASNNASDLWFKFYATATTATIRVNPSVSFISAIQAFSGGPTCGSLIEIGCGVATAVNSGITVNLIGLTPGLLYYYRVYGSAATPSQRTGTFCLCGSSGLGSSPLPVVLISFKAAIVQKNKVQLTWSTASELNSKHFELQYSADGNNFTTIAILAGKGTTSIPSDYSFIHTNPFAGMNYYRLKQVDLDDRYQYSEIVTAKINDGSLISLFPNPVKEKLVIESSLNTDAFLVDETGQSLQQIRLMTGRNEISVSKLNSGVYFIRLADNEIRKFNVMR